MKLRINGIFIFISLVLICAFPPIFVEQTTQASRLTWFGFLFTLAMVTGGAGFAHYHTTGRLTDDHSGPYARRYFKLLNVILISSFSTTIAMSVAFANMHDNSGWLGSTAKFMPIIVDPIFPWIERFRQAHISSPSNIQATKVEAIMSLSFIFGLITVASWAIYFGLMPAAERRIAAHQAKKYQKPRSKAFMLFAVIFGIYCVISNYLGWGEFVPPAASKFCLLHAPCYIRNDLTIIVAAGLKCFAIFGFGLGSLLMLYDVFTKPEVYDDGGPKDIRNM